MKSIKSASLQEMADISILGTYEGEGLDTQITNKNGLDITREVIETVIDSEEYEEGIANGWYIGFLGHPEDPNCMDFRNGCIVLTDMSIDENGKVYTKFNLINTPVGQIVATFQKAGVVFGVSIRGAGDIIGNSVDPETFMFRGFDLVAFPAYPESVPEFHSIAASTNAKDRQRYQSICAAVNAHLADVTSCSTIDVIKTQFAPQSDEYKLLEARKATILNGTETDINAQKIEAMTDLYLKATTEIESLKAENQKLRAENKTAVNASRRKIESLRRITDQQIADTLESLDKVTASKDMMSKRNAKLANELNEVKKSNLIYMQKVTASEKLVESQKSTISNLKSKLRETVTASTNQKAQTSNLDAEISRLKDEISACHELIASYQQEYADMYAGALGVSLDGVYVTANTSVKALKEMIDGATNTANIPAPGIPSADMIGDYYYNDSDDGDELTTL